MSNTIPGWLRFGLLGGAVAVGLAIAVLFMMPTDDPSPFVVPPTVRRPPPEAAMRPLSPPRLAEQAPSRPAAPPPTLPVPESQLAAPPVAASVIAAPPAAPAPASVASLPDASPATAPAAPILPAPPPAPVKDAAATPLAPPATQPTAAPPPSAPPGAAKPSFDVVTMSTEGNTVIAGRAVPAADVTVRNGDNDLGHVKADRHGNWVLLPDKKLAAGKQSLTLVERLADGAVVPGTDHVDFVVPARVATAAATQAASSGSQPVEGQVIVQPGESLWHLAKNAYGSGPRYVVIYRANQDKIREPDLIYPGQELAVPTLASASGSNVTPDSSIRSR